MGMNVLQLIYNTMYEYSYTCTAWYGYPLSVLRTPNHISKGWERRRKHEHTDHSPITCFDHESMGSVGSRRLHTT